MTHHCLASITACAIVISLAARGMADPFADNVASYDPGSLPPAIPLQDPANALGEPTRFTSPESPFGGAVTPFNAPFGSGELVSIGEGGQLTVSFDQPVRNDPGNPFGVDLLIFGNSFFGLDFVTGIADGAVFSEGGNIELSADGIDFVPVPGVEADGAFPTLGYSDLTQPFPSDAGDVPTDFTRPVDPAFNPTGLDILGIAAEYAGSGGGVPIDLESVGLDEISFVRISNPAGSGLTPEIDGLADVRELPEPASLWGFLLCAAVAAFGCRRRFARG